MQFDLNKTRLELVKEDITKQNVDAVVNAANHNLSGGGGVDGAIHRVAGPKLLMECKRLNGCKTGEAKITKGYDLEAEYVIHTVGPIWDEKKTDQDKQLSMCYINSLKIALNHKIKSIAFPNISTGVYGYPINEAANIAFNSVIDFIKEHSLFEKIIFCSYNNDNYNAYLILFKNFINN